MKLFLASAFDQVARSFDQKFGGVKGKKVVFIANPADPYEGDKWWVTIDREAFVKLGCVVIDVDLRAVSLEEFKKHLEEADFIHICGGSVFYSMILMREKGFDQVITEFVKENKIIYSGTSAGSMIVARDLSLEALDPEEKDFLEKMKDRSGFGLVNFLIMPHVNNPDFVNGNIEVIKKMSERSEPLIFLYDGQAVLVEDDKLEIMGNLGKNMGPESLSLFKNRP